ncbi:type I phosphomannose isomerase catalytic subunit [Jeotgalibacillus terrae]|uniref:Mannose-6-phosphate isomerase n=1 Tax=Jeotgalibacillus terrae TaxID=587735 RepID=A0ABW5ZJM4_9BACL|nr:type I phosphomannose isomerase catalytic subunit [Jeotgalibacillus terrae]MBM7579638.1 mannose-6-phosphate isomerase [Jeotgalibacillus terrae]
MTIYKLTPTFQNRIWGGRKLETDFGYVLPDGPVGECWGISAHPNGQSLIENGPFKGRTLASLWKNHREEVFGQYDLDEFPLLVKVLDAKDDLSVQVHPNDQQALALEGEPYGKTECWYILDAEPGAELIIGHSALTAEEFRARVEAGEWDQLLQRHSVQTGDFVFVESGTIHAIGAGILILEIQQSSDITYRVYDFDRKDTNGKKRELHIDKAIKVSAIPYKEPDVKPILLKAEHGRVTQLIDRKEFTVIHHQANTGYTLPDSEEFLLLTVINGSGKLADKAGGMAVSKGDHLLVPRKSGTITVDGDITFITACQK